MINDSLNIGLRGHDVNAEDLPELSQKLKEYGISNVQLVLKKSCKGFNYLKKSFIKTKSS